MSWGHDILWRGRVVIWVINSFFKHFVVLHTFINNGGKRIQWRTQIML